jgi:hypothetical protein
VININLFAIATLFTFLTSDAFFQLRMSSKQLDRLSKKAAKEQRQQEAKVSQCLKKGNVEGARDEEGGTELI